MEVEKNPTSTLKIGGFSEKKIFFKFAETSLIIRLKKVNLPHLAVFRRSLSIGKKSNFNFQNRGEFVKKMFRKCVETSVIISLDKGNLPRLAILGKNQTSLVQNQIYI